MVHLHQDTWRVLLIDENPFKQNLRATILRNYAIEVDTASNLTDAERLWINHGYDLILLASVKDSPEALALPDLIRKHKPRQRIGLLVGAPSYIQEVGGIPKRASKINLPPQSLFAPELMGVPARPQWQQMVQRIVGQ